MKLDWKTAKFFEKNAWEDLEDKISEHEENWQKQIYMAPERRTDMISNFRACVTSVHELKNEMLYLFSKRMLD